MTGGATSECHVIPRRDLIDHDANEQCVCQPTPLFEPGGVVYQHHSLDNREATEGDTHAH